MDPSWVSETTAAVPVKRGNQLNHVNGARPVAGEERKSIGGGAQDHGEQRLKTALHGHH